MAKYKALVSFSGIVTMYRDEIKDFDDEKQKDIIEDLLDVGYIVPADGSADIPQGEPKKENTPPPDEKAPAAQDDSAAEAAADEELAGDESGQTEDNSQAAEDEQAPAEEQPKSDVVKNETKRSKKR